MHRSPAKDRKDGHEGVDAHAFRPSGRPRLDLGLRFEEHDPPADKPNIRRAVTRPLPAPPPRNPPPSMPCG